MLAEQSPSPPVDLSQVCRPSEQLVSCRFTIRTRYWHALDDGRVQCDVCPRACRLHEGQRGLCFVRGRVDDQIVLTSYGRSSGFCVDPVEKKPLNHFLPGTPVLSFGTAGCNLACKFARTGTSPSPGRSTRSPMLRPRRISPPPRVNSGCVALADPGPCKRDWRGDQVERGVVRSGWLSVPA
jgi:hypothetical protein